MESTKLNPTQLHLLRMFAYHKDEESLNELKEVWLEHVRKKLSEEVEKVWKEKNMTNEMLEELLNTHIRTPYK
ncbi:MAG: hypothetical protein LBD28_00920 [Tannerellaceae bacterium]|nr:hypothetical protein [Tannerellaceae bacterium]